MRDVVAEPPPLVVTGFAAFCVLATVCEVLLLLYYGLTKSAPPFYERIVPFVGWVPTIPFTFALYWALVLRFRPRFMALLAALGMLSLGVFLGGVTFLSHYHRENYGNPWLTVSGWQLLFTVALPLVWAVLLLSPRVIRFSRAGVSSAVLRPPGQAAGV